MITEQEFMELIFDIWSRAEKSNIWITAANISWKENLDGDGESRKKKRKI